MQVRSNHDLQDITALGSLTYVGGNLRVVINANLPACQVTKLVEQLDGANGLDGALLSSARPPGTVMEM